MKRTLLFVVGTLKNVEEQMNLCRSMGFECHTIPNEEDFIQEIYKSVHDRNYLMFDMIFIDTTLLWQALKVRKIGYNNPIIGLTVKETSTFQNGDSFNAVFTYPVAKKRLSQLFISNGYLSPLYLDYINPKAKYTPGTLRMRGKTAKLLASRAMRISCCEGRRPNSDESLNQATESFTLSPSMKSRTDSSSEAVVVVK